MCSSDLYQKVLRPSSNAFTKCLFIKKFNLLLIIGGLITILGLLEIIIEND